MPLRPAYELLARIPKALSSPVRIELLDLLAQAPRDVESLARELEQSVANTSQHLQVLRRAQLVASDRQGTRVVYRLADDSVHALLRALWTDSVVRLAELERLVDGAFADATIAPRKLVRKALAGEAT